MKKLPIGIQSIEKIRTQDYIYIDKTQFALELIEGDAPITSSLAPVVLVSPSL